MKGYSLDWVVMSDDPQSWWKAYCRTVAGVKIEDGKLMRLVWIPAAQRTEEEEET